ncbi:MAG: PqqD family peptide modification chaperone, partial [Firmicutes bacterium]|nr:PqqD family peptide modification chaperone [Bacillota bacterium]
MVHQYRLNGYNIILDSNSGCIHTVDDVAYDIISMYESNSPEEISAAITSKHNVSEEDVAETLEDIEELKASRQLFTEDIFSGAAPIFKKRQSVVKAICLHVAHACNMRC